MTWPALCAQAAGRRHLEQRRRHSASRGSALRVPRVLVVRRPQPRVARARTRPSERVCGGRIRGRVTFIGDCASCAGVVVDWWWQRPARRHRLAFSGEGQRAGWCARAAGPSPLDLALVRVAWAGGLGRYAVGLGLVRMPGGEAAWRSPMTRGGVQRALWQRDGRRGNGGRCLPCTTRLVSTRCLFCTLRRCHRRVVVALVWSPVAALSCRMWVLWLAGGGKQDGRALLGPRTPSFANNQLVFPVALPIFIAYVLVPVSDM